MPDDRKTVYVNDKPISIFLWAEVQHCVNAYDSDLYLKVRKGEAEIVDGRGDRIGWGGFAGDGQHIYVRLLGDAAPLVITINAPAARSYLHPDFLTLNFSAVNGLDGASPAVAAPSGVKSIEADLDSVTMSSGQVIDLYTLALGDHTLTVVAVDLNGNASTQSVTFTVSATVQSLVASVNRFYQEGKIDNAGIRNRRLAKLNTAQTHLDQGNIKAAKNTLRAFITAVEAQSGKHITAKAVALLIADAQWVIDQLQ